MYLLLPFLFTGLHHGCGLCRYLHYRNYFFVTSVFAQMESQQYFSPDDNSNSTNVVKVEINVVRFSINGSAPSIFMYF
jgi:hypothetical protein